MNTQQLTELTNRINERLAEFGEGVFSVMPAGVVRLVHGVIEEWWEADEKAWPKIPADDPVLDAYSMGYERGKEVAKPKPEPKFVTQTPPVAETVAAVLGPEHTVVTPLKTNGNGHHEAAVSHFGNALPDIYAVIKELKRQSMAGMMPTQAQFDAARPANWATAQAQCKRFDMTWGQLAEEAGLKMKPNGKAA